MFSFHYYKNYYYTYRLTTKVKYYEQVVSSGRVFMLIMFV